MGLRARLVCLVVLALAPACALIAYHTVEQRRDAIEAARHEAVDLLRLGTQKHRELIVATRQLLISLAQLPLMADAECGELLARVMAPYPYYTNLGAANRDGRVICSAVPADQPVSIADRGYFRRALDSRQFSIGEYQVGRITDIRAINFGYPVTGEGERVEGIVYAALNLSWLERLIDRLELDPGITLTVLDGNGTILARSPDDGQHIGQSVAGHPLVENIIARGEGVARLNGLDGTLRLNAWAPLHERSATTVYLNVGVPLSAVLSKANRTAVTNTALLLGVAFLAGVAAWAGGNRLVLGPVRALAATAHRIREGDFNARTGLVRGGDEIGQLAQDFDAMAAGLQRLTRALKTLGAGNRSLIRADSEQQLLDSLCRVLVQQGGYRAAWVSYVSEASVNKLEPVARAGTDAEALEAFHAAMEHVGRPDDGGPPPGPAARAINTGHRQVVNNIRAELETAELRDLAEQRGYASAAVFPLPVQGRFIGALSIYSADPDAFNAQELALLEEAAGDLAFGIETMRTRNAHEQARAAIERMAYYDELTGLPNHASLEHYLQSRLEPDATADAAHGVLLLDLERFRDINNAFGFHRGDLLLKHVADRLRAFSDQTGIIGRLHGDAFVLVVAEANPRSTAELALRVLEAFDPLFELDGVTVNIGACIGITLSPPDVGEAGHLIRHADVAARHAKVSGQPYAFYTRKADVNNARRLSIIGELGRAMDRDELQLHYQPKIDMRTRRVRGAEALLRWQNDRFGHIGPDEFVPIAEQTGFIRALTGWVLSEAMRQAGQWWGGDIQIPVAVNLSARDLDDPELFDKIERLLIEWNITTRAIEFEITESAIMHDSERAMETLNRLSQLGIRLSVDDFGTGYSSLSYLQRLPVDAVKIDKSFIIDMLDDEESLAIVRATIDLAHDMGLQAIAEGVEDGATWDRLASLHCDFAQGFFISQAMPADRFAPWRREWENSG